MRPNLTPKQENCLETIARLTTEKGVPPTYRELADAMGHSTTSSAQYMTKRLIEEGYLVRAAASSSRSLRLADSSRSVAIGSQLRVAVNEVGIDELANTIAGELDPRELARLSGLLQARVA